MLISTVLTLQPTAAVTLPADQGRAVHAWFLNEVRRHDPVLAQAIHDEQGPKPFTCSSLQGVNPSRDGISLRLSPQQSVWIRLTSLRSTLTTLLLERILPNLPPTLTLGDAGLRIEAVGTSREQHAWAGQTSYAGLLQEFTLPTRSPDRRLRLGLASPVTFKRGQQHLPVPLPELVVQSWLDRWNAFAEVALPAELTRYAAECLALSYYDLHTEVVHFGQATLIGCTGQVSYYALNPDPYWLRLVHTLAAYSLFCGTGHKTTQGLGQTRKL